ncbi:hypothetical protein M407DRAFT_45985, partial [Tulasnella calospora MUT 4182]
FSHEVCLLNDLSHPRIVKLIGFVEDARSGIAWIILPWEKNGNLREFILSGNWQLPERISLIHDVTSGIDYLHSREPPICHGDLKSLNILVNSEGQAALTDFGSARPLEPAITLASSQWTLKWAAPELLHAAKSSLASDIWAFGWIVWEVLTGDIPFEGENDVSTVCLILKGELPEVHGDVHLNQVVALANLMNKCWSLNPSERPTASDC